MRKNTKVNTLNPLSNSVSSFMKQSELNWQPTLLTLNCLRFFFEDEYHNIQGIDFHIYLVQVVTKVQRWLLTVMDSI